MGAIWGVGYIVRRGRDEEYDVVSYKFDKVSEPELHALFAEAVVSGRPDAADDIEIMTGMPFLDPSHRDLIPHFDDPRFAYFILAEQRGKAGGTANSLESVKERLLKAVTIDEVRQIVTGMAFARPAHVLCADNLRRGLSRKASKNLADILRRQRQLEFSSNRSRCGLAECRDDWNLVSSSQHILLDRSLTLHRFSKNLNLDLPLLKILGGASITDLAEEATERLLPSAIPLVQLRGDDWITPLSIDGQLVLDASPKPWKMEISKYESSSGSRRGSDTPSTELSSLSASIKVDGETQEPTFQRRIPMSLNQEHSWKLQKHAHDPTTFTSTIGMYMKGYMDMERLSRAFRISFQRHEVFRTCFFDTEDDLSQPMQAVMKVPWARFDAVRVADRAAAEQGFRDLDRQSYNLAIGDTMKMVDFYWSPNDHVLIIAYNQLVCDGWSYEQLFVEIAKLYNGAELPPPPQYAEFATRQRLDYETGRMDGDIAFWKSLYKSLPPVLPVMSLPQAQTRRPPTWEQYTLTARLSSIPASRIKEGSRKQKATPMHFYLAAYYVLLARLTGSADIPIGVADANRSNLEDLSTMGFFYNILPLHLVYSMDCTFGEALAMTKEQMRNALLHSRVPHHVILERLGVSNITTHSPLFQAVFDYKQGQAESGSIGSADMAGVLASRSRTPYDITLEMSDDPTQDPLITFKLQSSFYGPDDVQTVMSSYMSILSILSQDQTLQVNEVQPDQALEVKKA